MKIAKGIIFDFNGTLFFDSRLHVAAFRECLSEAGKPIPSDLFLIKNVFGKPNGVIYKELFDRDASEEAILRFAETKENKYIDACKRYPESARIAPGAGDMLDYLKEKEIPYALATGSDLKNVNFYLDFLKISKWFSFDNIVYSDGKIKGKPDPEIYISAANKIGLDPSECIIFEDAGSGFKAANAAGALATIAVREKGLPSPIDDTVDVAFEINDFSNYKELLLKYGL